MTNQVICRSRQHLNQLVAQHVTKIFSAYVLASNPDLAPDYTTWAGVEAVVQAMEREGFWVTIEGASGVGMTPNTPDAAFHKMGNTHEAGYSIAPSIPIAVCLAALAAKGVEVSFEPG